MYAVFESGGKQYKASKGDIVFVEKLGLEPGKAVSFNALVISDGASIEIGTPFVKDAKVRAKVLGDGKERKIIVFKYKPKIHERKKQGHRQPFTKIEITAIDTKGNKSIESAEAKTETVMQVTETSLVEKKAPAEKPATVKATAKSVAKPAETKSSTTKTGVKPAETKKATTKTGAKPAANEKTKPAAKPAAKKPASAKPTVKDTK